MQVIMKPSYSDMDIVVLNTIEEAKDWLLKIFEFSDLPSSKRTFAGIVNLAEFEEYWQQNDLSGYFDYIIQ